MPKTHPKQPGRGTLRLAKGWYELRKQAGYRTDAEVAVAMGVDPATVYRLQKGIGSPSAAFICAALDAFGLTEADFHRVFEKIPSKPSRARRAA